MKEVLVLTMASPAYKEISDITFPVMKRYCQKHYYDLEIIHVPDWDYSYRKHEYLKEKLKDKHIKLVFYIDCDALIMNHNIKVESFVDDEHDFFITEDVNELNGGVFILKNTEWARLFNDDVLGYRNIYVNEQSVYVLAYNNFLTHSEHFKILNHPSINSYPYSYYPEYKNVTHEQGNFEIGDFVFHVPGKSLKERVEILNTVKEKIIE